MNLTNKYLEKQDQSISLTKYLGQPDKKNAFTSEISCRSDTQLLESSPIHQNSSFCISSEESLHRPFILKSDKENSQFSDLPRDFEIGTKEKRRHNLAPSCSSKVSFEYLCKDLVEIIKNLQSKVDRLERKDEVLKINSSKATANFCQGSFLSSLGKSSSTADLGKSSEHACNGNNDNFMQVLLELIETKGQIRLYQEQNQKLQKQVIQLKLQREQQVQIWKKKSTECLKMKELLKQYQNYLRKNKCAQGQTSYKNSKSQLDNSLDLRLREHQKQNKKIGTKNMLDSIQTVLLKQTPKTPHHFRYHSCQNLMNQDKTKARSHHKSPNTSLRNIDEFSFLKTGERQKNMYQKLTSEKVKDLKQDNCFFSKYPFNELLELQNADSEQISGIFQLDHFSTMESITDLAKEVKGKGNMSHNKCEQKGKWGEKAKTSREGVQFG